MAQIKQILIIFAVAAMLALAGCAEQNSDTGDNVNTDDIAKETGENVDSVDVGGSYWYEVKLTEKNQQGLVKSQPPFTFDHSLERQNLINRYKYLNDHSNTHHVYLLGNDGTVISYFVAQGKVSSVNSKLTNDKQIVRVEGCEFWKDDDNGAAAAAEGSCYKTVESPQMDGSYGSNGEAIFFFTTSGEYVESDTRYVVSEKPLNIQTPISLEHNVGNSTAGS